MGSFNEFSKTPVGKMANRPETLMAYEKHYMELLRRYKDEIRQIEEMMQNLREERKHFYEDELPAIRKKMEMDEVSPEIRAKWLDAVQTNVEKSFKISEELIEHYVTKNLDEFKTALQQEIGG